jgi:hypothetical protein
MATAAPGVVLCSGVSSDGYHCTYDHGHPGPCSRVLWARTGPGKRVYWWPGAPASETFDFMPRRGR